MELYNVSNTRPAIYKLNIKPFICLGGSKSTIQVEHKRHLFYACIKNYAVHFPTCTFTAHKKTVKNGSEQVVDTMS